MSAKRIVVTIGLMSCYLVSNAQEVALSEEERHEVAENFNCLKDDSSRFGNVDADIDEDCYLKIAGEEVHFPGIAVRGVTSAVAAISKATTAREAGKAFVSGIGAGIGAWSADRLSSSSKSKSGCSGNKQGCEIHPESLVTPDQHFDY